MSAELVEYEVESWTPTAIVFKNDTFCATEVFTIDLRTESVNGAGHRINEDLEFCKRFPVQEQQWNYRLADGFKVYWELRQKARPLPLRVFHSFFGH